MNKSITNKEAAITVKDLRKSFRLPIDSHSGVKQLLINLAKGRRKKGYVNQEVLKGISFEINKGDFFGIVGRNGSGKSTLLKLLAGIYQPDGGAVTTHGSIVPFIELGVGFNPELTGRENVFLNGALLGFSRQEMEAMYDDIVDFAELERFMDQKLKNYSSGMQVRLAFSIAIKAQGDILLLDEVLAVGDQSFQRKCFEYFRELRDQKKTVILVTHDMGAVKDYCTKALLIDRSGIVKIGSPDDVADEYSVRMASRPSLVNGSKGIIDIEVGIYPAPQDILKGPEMNLFIDYQSKLDEKYFIAYSIKRDGCIVSESSSQFTSDLELKKGKQRVLLSVDISNFTSGEYEIDIAFYNSVTSDIISYKNSAHVQLISNDVKGYSGLTVAKSSWKV